MELVMDYKIVLVNQVNQLYMLTKVFFYKSGIIDRASDTEPKNHQNLWGEPLLPKFDDETQKK